MVSEGFHDLYLHHKYMFYTSFCLWASRERQSFIGKPVLCYYDIHIHYAYSSRVYRRTKSTSVDTKSFQVNSIRKIALELVYYPYVKCWSIHNLTHLLQREVVNEDGLGKATGIKDLDLNPGLVVVFQTRPHTAQSSRYDEYKTEKV